MRRRTTLALVATPALIATALTAPAATASPDTPTAVPNTAPTWVAHAHHLGRAKSSAPVTARVYLAPRGGEAALRDAVAAVSTPGSAQYRDFLTAAQYHAAYDPTSATVDSVRSYLTSHGLRVTGVGSDNDYLDVRGTAAQAGKTFGVTIDRYQHDGQTVQAPTSAARVPANVRANILTISGLDTTTHRMVVPGVTAQTVSQQAATARTQTDPPPAGFRNARPCSLYYGQVAAKYQADFKTPLPKFQGKTLPYALCGYTGPQFRSAYEGATSLDGSGVTVAVIDAYASPTIASDTNTYATNHGDGAYGKGQLTQSNASTFTDQTACAGAAGWWGEQTLDIEAVHAMAPGANIRYYGAKSCNDPDLIAAAQRVVNQNKASIVTNSYGEPAEGESADSIAAWEQVFMQGALQGITFTFSSGDNGDELANTGIKQADYPTSDPYVTSVGGTATAIDSNGNLAGEAGWGTDKYSLSADGKSWTPVGYLYGSGGGASTLFNKPSYQSGIRGSYRMVPDVAMDADPTTGMLIGITQQFSDGLYYDEYRIGGTSLASPLFAGMTALAFEKSGGGPGLLNPTIYASSSSKDFTDVNGNPLDAGNVRVDFKNGTDASNGLLYSVRTFGQDSSLTTGPGYDEVTGVGSPNAGWLGAIPAPGSSG